uniref:Uncharacterized protein n=1 Tax=Mycena chlorophos TaxID=658473 RepID=A0ABQ0L653_MYCCL|nr:predicted protein [Mycena chlorophos]
MSRSKNVLPHCPPAVPSLTVTTTLAQPPLSATKIVHAEMPKATWEAPDDIFETSADGLRVRCKICRAEGKGRVGNWFKYTSGKAHLTVGAHVTAERNQRERVSKAAAEARRLNGPYDADAFTGYQTSTVSAVRNESLAMFPHSAEAAGEDVGNDPRSDAMEVDEMEVEEHRYRFALERLVGLRADDVATEAAAQAEDEVLANEESIQEAYRCLLTAAIAQGEFGVEEEEESTLTDADQEGADDDESNNLDDLEEGADNDCFPYPNKTIMLLDIMDNLPCCRFSTAQMSVVLRFARCLGAQNVPTLKRLRTIQHSLQKAVASEPQKIRTPLGNIFYLNNIRATIARDFANPAVAKHIHLFPEDVSKAMPLSETWQAERWKEYKPTQLTPMFSRGQRRFWVEELARRRDGSFVLLRSLVVRDGVLSTEAQTVIRDADGRWHYNEEARFESFPVDKLDRDFTEVLEMLAGEGDGEIHWTPGSNPVPPMPNPLHAKVADDKDLVVVMADIFQDDTSGNVSKQWDKHLVTCVRNGNLPGRLLQQEFNVKFVSSSQHASCAEQFAAIRDIIKATEDDPIHCYNADTKKKTAIILRAPG